MNKLREQVEKDLKHGWAHNCLLSMREGEQLFHQDSVSIRPTLDGYAIIPIEQYEAMKNAIDNLRGDDERH
jgi:hypothetical protein